MFDLLTFFSLLSAFSSVADGAHDWLGRLTLLEELNLSRTSVSARMLPSLGRCRFLDLSFTFVVDLAELVLQLQSVEHLVFGDDADTDVSQLFVVPKLPVQLLPHLQCLELYCSVTPEPDEIKARRVYRPLADWAAKKGLRQVTVHVHDAAIELDIR